MLGRRLPSPEIDNRDVFRLNLAGAPLLAATPDGRTVVALVREPAPSRDSVVFVDAASLEPRCSHRLERGVRYSGMLLGRSGRLYAFGTRRVGASQRGDAVLTIVDARTGALASQTVRRAERGKWRGWNTDWYVYGGALSADERRIVLSYHGHDTTGADRFRISAESGASATRRVGITAVHGAVAAVGRGFLGAAASYGLLRLNRGGRVVRRIRVTPETHLMDFALDDRRSLAYVSTCGKRPAIQRLHLARNRSETLPVGRFCGQPLAVHGDRFLALAGSRVSRRGYPAVWPRRLRLIDLADPGHARRVRRPGAPLDALAVG